jgi:2-oxoglutarate ferredoxin oxidoreductase subunit alpha
LVLAPGNVQEMFDFAALAFELAEKYRNPVLILSDAVLGQMKEGAVLQHQRPIVQFEKPYVVTGARGRTARNIRSMYLEGDDQELLNYTLQIKYDTMERDEQRYDTHWIEDADIVVVAFGTAARISLSAVREARHQGLRVGLFRPITLWPFPKNALRALSGRTKKFLVVEMNLGQMVEDVRATVHENVTVHFYGRPAGGIPSPATIIEKIKEI